MAILAIYVEGLDRMVVGFTYAINVYHCRCCEFDSSTWSGVLDAALCDIKLSVTCCRSMISSENSCFLHL